MSEVDYETPEKPVKIAITGGSNSSKALLALECMALGLGVETISQHIDRKFKPKAPKVFTEEDAQRLDKAQARRDRRNAKRLRDNQL